MLPSKVLTRFSALRRPAARRALAALAATLALVWLGREAAFARTCARVRADTLRLHVLAASDSEADQALKLQVRDAVLAAAGPLLASSADKAQAMAAAADALPALEAAAAGAVAAAGESWPVTAALVRRYFPTTQYENGLTLPAGWYDAVQVRIGPAAGHNWFCVLYPSLCQAAAGGGYAEPAENELVAGDYVIRFAALEWWQRLTGRAG